MTTSRKQSLHRTRNVFAILTLLVPLALFVVFERQAQRLDALALEGMPVQAQVTRVAQSGTTHYAYRVAGVDYRWSVKRAAAPHDVGTEFVATYLPRDPAFSRPISDRALAAAEAAKNRSFAWRVVLATCAFFGLFTLFTQLELRKLSRGETQAGQQSMADVRRRLGFAGLVLLPLLALITYFHASDARDMGQPVWPVVLGLVLTLGIFAGVFGFVTREGPTRIQQRAASLLAWVAPIAVGVAVLRLLMLVFGY